MQNSAASLISAIRPYRAILILIKGSPDPDAIASAYAMSIICKAHGIASTILAEKKLSLPQNKAFVQLLDIPLHFAPMHHLHHFSAYIVVDHQNAAGGDLVGGLPCAAHIDHHEPGGPEVKTNVTMRDTKAGSTSTILTRILREMDISLDHRTMTTLATALLYGIYTDTDKYAHAAEQDYEALEYLSRRADHAVFKRLTNIPLSSETLGLLKHAIAQKIIYKDWLIAGLGFVAATNRDSIAVIADFLLRREAANTVVVYALIEDRQRKSLSLDASFRTSLESLDLNDLIKRITPGGGARSFKGAYQIGLDYFAHAPNRGLLWECVSDTTMAILKHRRDEILITEVKGMFRRLRGIFRKRQP